MKQKDFLIVLVSLFILTILWVVFSLYHNYVTSTIEDPLSYQIAAIEGNFDTDTLSEILERKRVAPLYELSPTQSLLEIPESDEQSPEIATDSGDLSIQEDIGTESGGLIP